MHLLLSAEQYDTLMYALDFTQSVLSERRAFGDQAVQSEVADLQDSIRRQTNGED